MDPGIPVPQWPLSPMGRDRMSTLARSGALTGTRQIWSSTETKALQAAEILAAALDCPHDSREDMGENDRSATGYLPDDEFEAAADAFFGQPDQSVNGWETALHAQNRIVNAVMDCLQDHKTGDVLFVGHGAVGTLLFCKLSNIGITRERVQPRAGCVYSFNVPPGQPHDGWVPLEDFIQRRH